MKLIYAQEAVADLARLRAFIATHDPSSAQRIASDLVARIQHLRSFPEMGRGVPQAPVRESVRDLFVGRYVVRYMVQGQAVMVLRVWHHHESRVGDPRTA